MRKPKTAAAALKHEETRHKIVEMLKSNCSTYEIGTALDISPRLVRQIVQETVVTSLTEMATEIGRMAVAMVERWWLFHRKAMEGDVSASAESDRIFDRLLTLTGHDRNSVSILLNAGADGADASKNIIIRFQPGQETVLPAGGTKAIEHQPAVEPTPTSAPPPPPPPRADYTNVVDQEFANRRVAQLHEEYYAQKDPPRTSGPCVDSTGDKFFTGGIWKAGSCDQPPPKKRKERIIG